MMRFWRPSFLFLFLLFLIILVVAAVGASTTEDSLTYLPLVCKSVPYSLWSKVYSGPSSDGVGYVTETRDGGFAVSGASMSSVYPGLVIKLSEDGAVQWQKVHQMGGLVGLSHIQESDNGSLIVTGTGGNLDLIQVIKHSSDGTVLWRRAIDTDDDADNHVGGLVELDGGAIIAGTTGYDPWAWRVLADGSTAWRYEYIGGQGYSYLGALGKGADGGVIVAGKNGFGDGWVMKLNVDGSIAWQKTYTADEGIFQFFVIRPTRDGGYIGLGNGNNQPWLLKITGDGSVEWSQLISFNEDYYWLSSVTQSGDGGYLAVGSIRVSDPHGYRGLALKLSADGQVEWAKKHGEGFTHFGGVAAANSGGYVIVGSENSRAWVLRTDSFGSIHDCRSITPVDAESIDYPLTTGTSALYKEPRPPGRVANLWSSDGSLVGETICPASVSQTACSDVP